MKSNYLITTLAILGLAAMFSACKEDLSYDIPAEELYTRAFIKEFGLIDKAQDWNLAQAGQVTVNVPGHANSVKVYAKVGNCYYIVANLIDIEGTVSIPLDIPETCNDLMVKIDGHKYYTTNGGSVSVAGSRAVNASSNSYTTAANQTISVAVANADGEQQYFKFNAQQMGPVLAAPTDKDYGGGGDSNDPYYWPDYYSITPGAEGKVVNPKTSAGGRVPETELNLIKNDIYQNFSITLDEPSFVIYPMYWFTSQTHTIGIYFIDDKGDPVKNASDEIIRVPVYTTKGPNDIQWYKKNEGTSSDPSASSDLVALTYDEKLKSLNGWPFFGEGDNYNVVDEDKLATFTLALQNYFNEGNTFAITNTSWVAMDFPSKDQYEIASVTPHANANNAYFLIQINFKAKSSGSTGGTSEVSYPEDYPEELKETNGSWVSYSENLGKYWEYNVNGTYAFKEEALMRSQGIKVDIEGWNGKIGMYTTFSDKLLYSQAHLNTETNRTDKGDDYEHSFAATFFHPITNRLFFSFEDWTGGYGDADMNDVVFMIEGVDKMDTDKGEIPVKVKETNESDEALAWLIAAEDLGTTDDFDFNDVVFTLNSVTTNTTTVNKDYGDKDKTQLLGQITKTEIHKEITVKALAAGGTLPIWLHFNDGTTDYILGPNDKVYANTEENASAIADCEWHKWFSKPSSNMVNTGSGSLVPKPASCCLGTSYTKTSEVTGNVTGSAEPNVANDEWKIEAFKTFTMTDCYANKKAEMRGFYLTVNGYTAGNNMADVGGTSTDESGKEYNITSAEPGAAPQMFIIPDVGNNGKWYWPAERHHILECYPSFKEWVNNGDANKEWHKAAPSSSVFDRSALNEN